MAQAGTPARRESREDLMSGQFIDRRKRLSRVLTLPALAAGAVVVVAAGALWLGRRKNTDA